MHRCFLQWHVLNILYIRLYTLFSSLFHLLPYNIVSNWISLFAWFVMRIGKFTRVCGCLCVDRVYGTQKCLNLKLCVNVAFIFNIYVLFNYFSTCHVNGFFLHRFRFILLALNSRLYFVFLFTSFFVVLF